MGGVIERTVIILSRLGMSRISFHPSYVCLPENRGLSQVVSVE